MDNQNKDVMFKKRINIFFGIMIFLFLIMIFKMGSLQLINTKASIIELERKATKIVYGPSMPRGRIYDKNYNVIVDNIGVKTIMYKKENGTSTKKEIEIAYLLANNIDVDYKKLSDINLRRFWYVNNLDKIKNKITNKEYELYERRKIKASRIEELKLKRITDEELSTFNELDRKAAYIYYLMNNGYSYDDKIIKEDITDKEYTYIVQNNIVGTSINTTWKRMYMYGDVLKNILGNVSYNGIPNDLKNYYIDKGYALNDRVGISYLEYMYNDELAGKKDKYELKNGNKTLIEEGSRGNDIVLSIDINLQKKLEEIITEELFISKKEPNTEYYDHSSVIISNPKTGEILAAASKKIIYDGLEYKVKDYTTSLLTNSSTPGSIVKGASMLVGYKTGNLQIGDVYYDKCIKLKNTKEKCSWSKSLGALNDVTALKYSSNSYQFQLALKVAGVNYYYNMPLKVNNNVLDTYRSVFNEVGLGVMSKIDLPNESTGYKGKTINAGLLLNFAIGQYDTYTSLQLSSYINTIANEGERLKLNLVSEIRNATKDDSIGSIKYKYEKQVLNAPSLDNVYYKRIKEGFREVMLGSLGFGYMGTLSNPAGKTGTSESFYDSDNDGKIDKETYTKSFIGYAPYDNPVMSIIAISPNVSRKNDNNSFTSRVNKRITSRISNFFFENYK